MPVYEFVCLDCKKRFEIRLPYDEYGSKQIQCCYCLSERVARKITRIRVKRSEASRNLDLPDPSRLEGLENDPQSLGRMMRSMSQESDEDLGPEFTEVIDRLESGQKPDEIEKELPDLVDGNDITGNTEDS